MLGGARVSPPCQGAQGARGARCTTRGGEQAAVGAGWNRKYYSLRDPMVRSAFSKRHPRPPARKPAHGEPISIHPITLVFSHEAHEQFF